MGGEMSTLLTRTAGQLASVCAKARLLAVAHGRVRSARVQSSELLLLKGGRMGTHRDG